MPPLPPVPNVIRVQFKEQVGADIDVLDRIYLQYAGDPPSVADLNAFCASCVSEWGSNLAAMAHPSRVLTEVLAQDLSSDIGAEGTDGAGVAGTRSGGELPAAVVALINFSVARRYRGGKPRIYFPFGTDTDVLTPQTWTAAFLTAYSGAWGSFINGILAAAWAGGGPLLQTSVSYYLGSTDIITGTPPYMRGRTKSTLRAVPATFLVTNYTCNPTFSNQRRRDRPGS